MLHPCENCGEVDEHTCVVDGVEYGPFEIESPYRLEAYIATDDDD